MRSRSIRRTTSTSSSAPTTAASRDRGRRPHLEGRRPPRAFRARARGIAFDPQQPRRVYVGSFAGGGFFKSEDHGRHWQRRLFGSGTVYVAGIAVDPVDHTIYISTVRADDGLWKSTDFGETFTRIDRAPGAPPDEFLGLSGRGIAVDPHNRRTLFHAGSTGVWRSQDAGASWVNVEATSNTQSHRRPDRFIHRLCDRLHGRVQEHRRRRFVRPEVRRADCADGLGADSSQKPRHPVRRNRGRRRLQERRRRRELEPG